MGELIEVIDKAPPPPAPIVMLYAQSPSEASALDQETGSGWLRPSGIARQPYAWMPKPPQPQKEKERQAPPVIQEIECIVVKRYGAFPAGTRLTLPAEQVHRDAKNGFLEIVAPAQSKSGWCLASPKAQRPPVEVDAHKDDWKREVRVRALRIGKHGNWFANAVGEVTTMSLYDAAHALGTNGCEILDAINDRDRDYIRRRTLSATGQVHY
jgi:hypothetical protein